jgi:hypothetical protein
VYAAFWSVVPLVLGTGIGSAAAVKIFRADPLYFVSSLSFSKSSRSVGSRDGATAGREPFAPVVRRATVRCPVVAEGAVGGAELAAGDESARKNLTNKMSAANPSTAAAITFVRFSVPRFTYAPAFK